MSPLESLYATYIRPFSSYCGLLVNVSLLTGVPLLYTLVREPQIHDHKILPQETRNIDRVMQNAFNILNRLGVDS